MIGAATVLILVVFIVSAAGEGFSVDIADERWQPDSAQWHWGRDRQIDLIDTKVEVRLDPLVVYVAGTVTLTFAPIEPTLKHLKLDAERLTIDRVRDREGNELEFDVEERGFTVNFPRSLHPAETTLIRIDYHGEPTMGLYFIPSVKADPEKIPMIWSQGEAEENRFWFPGYDYPNDKATSAVSVTTPRPNVVVSNGSLTSLDDNPDGTRTFHWAEKVPNSTYHVALAVGEFDSAVEYTSRGLPVTYYCRKGEGEKLLRSLGDTPEMIEFFEDAIGVPYPYEKYAQVIVTDFIHGGMENASMTIEHERALYSAEAADFYRERTNGLLSHELAHQWYGDLLTLNDWAYAWLNEGFATYFSDLWVEHRWGHDRFLLEMDGTRESGRSAARRTRRSIVHHRYVHPDDLFDSYAYSKAASVLHMLRGIVGDSIWWAAVHRYVSANAAGNVETVDLRRAFETECGRDFDAFFHQWVDQGGHPELKVETSYDPEIGLLEIGIRQNQKVDDVTPLHQFPLDVEWVTKAGRDRKRIWVDREENTTFIPLEHKPQYVLIDPDGWLLAEIDHSQSTTALLAQLQDSIRVLARLYAVRALGKKENSPEVLGGLTRALRADPMADIREAAADALAQISGDDSRDSLLVGLDDPDVVVRNRVIYALGKFERDATVFERLESLARSGALPMLRGSAIEAAAMVDPQRAIPLGKWGVTQRSERHTVEIDAFSGLKRSQDPALIDLGLQYARIGQPTPVRSAAAGLIEDLAQYEKDKRKRDRASRELEGYLDDRNMLFRRPLMRAIGELGRTGAVEGLERVLRQSPQYSEQRTARDAIAAVRKRESEDRPATLEKKIEDIAAERKKLESRLGDLEKKIDAMSKRSESVADTVPSGEKPH